MDNFPYLFAAYTIIVVALLGYVFMLQRRQERLGRELEELKQSAREKKTPG